jgi:CspA family cold shock protein
MLCRLPFHHRNEFGYPAVQDKVPNASGLYTNYTARRWVYVGQSDDIRQSLFQHLNQPNARITVRPERRLSHGFQGARMAPMNGSVKRLVSDKGFGFILASDGNEYFFHNSACRDTRFDDLQEGQAVTFERGQGPKGPRAENVKVG